MEEIVLALGGGGAKGLAHIGVIRQLELEGFVIRAVSGTSAGAIIGGLYCSGYTTSEIEDILHNIDRLRLFHRLPNDGPSLLGVSGLYQALIKSLGQRTFSDLKIPFACTATDINTSQEIIFTHGLLIEAIMSSIAIPGVFPPQQIDQYTLVDGGVLDPVPVSLARWLEPTLPTIAVCLTPIPEEWPDLPLIKIPEDSPIPRPLIDQFTRLRIGQAFRIFLQSMDVTSRVITELRLSVDRPEVIIRPDVAQYGILDNVPTLKLIEIGEDAVKKSLPEIRQVLTWKGQISRRFRTAEPPGVLINSTEIEKSDGTPK